ncbi:MAG: hypothetical protein VYD19_02705 [Myxococcota bacterium]|nr:hypothetical protein [Myxococcota bacterium]
MSQLYFWVFLLSFLRPVSQSHGAPGGRGAREYARAISILKSPSTKPGQSARRAASLLERACSAGHQPACNALAGVLINQLSEERGGLNEARLSDPHAPEALKLRRAISLYETACDSNYSAACYNLSHAYAEGAFVQHEPAYALRFAKRACALNDAEGCLLEGRLHKELTPKLTKPRLLAWEKSCTIRAGAGGCVALARYYQPLNGSLERHLALRFAERGCEGGSGQSCVTASAIFDARGEGDRAEVLLSRACEGERVEGCAGLAARQAMRGEDSTATLQRGCEGRSMQSCAALAAQLLERQEDEAQAKAAQLAKLACDAEVPEGCYTLYLVRKRSQTHGSDRRALRALAQRACRGGVRAACAALVGH